jgi:COMPASS component SPP1
MQEQQRMQDQRQQELDRAYRAQELDRRRREDDHLRALEHQRERERREAELMLLAEEKRRELEERRQFEIERHRAATEKQRLVNEQRQFDSERRSIFDMPPQQFPARQSPVVSPVSISRLVSNPDPPQISQSTASISPDSSASSNPPSHHDPRPIKKRRYSISPTRHGDDQERIARDRDRMVVGELGYGRVDSPLPVPSAPRRPGSHNQPRKAVAVADLLSDKDPPPLSPLSQLPRPDPRDTHRILSPSSRRSPPGSQIGRAKAARKSDEYIASLREHAQPPPLPSKDRVQSPILPESTKSAEDVKVKQETKPTRLRHISEEIRRTSITDESRQKKAPPPPAPKLQSANSKSKRDDPHEFFLHQYDQVPTPAKSGKSAHSDSGGMPSLPSNPISPTVITPKNLPATAAVVPLDKELEDLVSSPTSSRVPASSAPTVRVQKQEESDDMDLAVDLAVTELVENLENDDKKHVGMEVDVEDELLSLVDDCLPPATNSSRRTAASSSIAVPNSHASDSPSQVPTAVKQQQQQSSIQSTSDNVHPSPPIISNASAVVQAVGSNARSSSARATSDRDSMPPPSTTLKGGTSKRAADAGSAVPAELPSTAIAVGKKRKETTAKVCV